MTLTAIDPYFYPPRGLDRAAAARYLGIDLASFDRLVLARKLPGPRCLDRTDVWDRQSLEAAFETFPSGGCLVPTADREPSPHPKVYTPDTLAVRWQCSGNHVRGMIRRSQIPAFKAGRMLRIKTADVIAYEGGGGCNMPAGDLT